MKNVRPMETDELAKRYVAAKRVVVDAGHADEIAWQARAGQEAVTPRRFVREAAWVVLSAGMSEGVVRSRFPAVSHAMHDFDPAGMVSRRPEVREAALAAFGHVRKIDAILDIGRVAQALGQNGLAERLADPEPFLVTLPYIGPITWRHLAKNLGAPVAKADRHLVRIAAAAGRADVDSLCDEIAGWLGEPVAVVDLVLWRWAVLHGPHCLGPCDGVPHVQLEDGASLGV